MCMSKKYAHQRLGIRLIIRRVSFEECVYGQGVLGTSSLRMYVPSWLARNACKFCKL